ncbi:LuxR C-terminal-related transcriptional regulator [Marinithermus hydrothermalis]|uniref:Two component transcriptional regulator, LuxR family n=1 Tax=Marinithermus hydrothermalis (strain DSM 14884 / JCM 11576 / T1) TaxID=869210 RepID=F2NQZ5_MARHT|nr:response regulator transcription factor [Marinithermus hydrothermalis]AEB12573.1 two component transcriptional regulator, LuxR family [Marinithermus hydrothermalis DSM 14884]
MTRIVVADSCTLLCQGLSRLLETEADLRVTGAYTRGREALRAVLETRPDVFLVDTRLEDVDAFVVVGEVRRARPEVRVVVFSAQPEAREVRQAYEAGAAAFVEKRADLGALLQVIRRVRRGERLLDAARAAAIVQELEAGQRAVWARRAARLAARELEILQLLAQGCSNQEIADALGLSEKTVRNRLSEVFAKLGAQNRTQAALFAVRAGIAPGVPA